MRIVFLEIRSNGSAAGQHWIRSHLTLLGIVAWHAWRAGFARASTDDTIKHPKETRHTRMPACPHARTRPTPDAENVRGAGATAAVRVTRKSGKKGSSRGRHGVWSWSGEERIKEQFSRPAAALLAASGVAGTPVRVWQ